MRGLVTRCCLTTCHYHSAEGGGNVSFIKEMMQDIHIDESVVAVRILEILENSLAGRFLTCPQLALLVERFPDGSYERNNFYSFRVELVITFFSKLVDVINFDLVLKELNCIEYAMVVVRLGWLNVWNPLKAEGHYMLDMSRREERQMVRALMLLSFSEQGQTWQEPQYRLTLESPPVEEWKLPIEWFSETGLPQEGVVSMHYFSGKGKGLMECSPNPRCRLVLMALVLAQPYSEDMWSDNKNTVEHAEALLDVPDIQCELSFRTERQQELQRTGNKTTGRSAISNDNSKS